MKHWTPLTPDQVNAILEPRTHSEPVHIGDVVLRLRLPDGTVVDLPLKDAKLRLPE